MAPSSVRVVLASAYPYTSVKKSCNKNLARQIYYPTSQTTYSYSKTLGASATYYAGLQTGPVVIRVRADTAVWRLYKSGVLNDPACYGAGGLNHAVVIVGHSTDVTSNLAYWLVRNSWGTGWGEAGYIRIAVTESGYGICGLANLGWNIAMKAF